MVCTVNSMNWFEIPVKNMDRARNFYGAVFGTEFHVQTGHPIEMAFWPKPKEATGAGGALIKVDKIKPSTDGTLVYFTVDSIEEMLAKVHDYGGLTLLEKKSIGEYGWIAHFQDSEGNRVGLHRWK